MPTAFTCGADDTILYLLGGDLPGGGGGGSHPPIGARTGPVRMDGVSFADDQGPWNPLAASLMWGLWGERNDPDRLDENLKYLADHGTDYVRALGMVGWQNREIDPNASDYWQVADSFLDRLQRHGMRAQITVFADAQRVMPDYGKRLQFADQWASKARSRQSAFQLLEAFNEGWQNGGDDFDHVREVGQHLKFSGVPVTLTSMPQVVNNTNWCEMYGGSGVDLVSIHYDRDISKGMWRPVRQPWGWPIEYDGGCGMPRAAVSNEPIGPQSSVAEDSDPLRLAMSYVTAFVSKNAGYVYHTGAGVSGEYVRGRYANVYEYPPEIMRGLRAMRALMPAGMANWTRYNSGWAGYPWDGMARATEDGRLLRSYAVVGGNQTAMVMLEQKADITVRALAGYHMTRYDPRDGSVMSEEDVPAYSMWTIPNSIEGCVFLGTAL